MSDPNHTINYDIIFPMGSEAKWCSNFGQFIASIMSNPNHTINYVVTFFKGS